MNMAMLFLTVTSCLTGQLGSDVEDSAAGKDAIERVIPSTQSRTYPANLKIFVQTRNDVLYGLRRQDGLHVDLESQYLTHPCVVGCIAIVDPGFSPHYGNFEIVLKTPNDMRVLSYETTKTQDDESPQFFGPVHGELISEDEGGYFGSDQGMNHQVAFTFAPPVDANGVAAYVLYEEREDGSRDPVQAYLLRDGLANDRMDLFVTADETSEKCYRLSAIDIAGNEAIHADLTCIAFPANVETGCAQTSEPAMGILLFGLLFASVRRKLS